MATPTLQRWLGAAAFGALVLALRPAGVAAQEPAPVPAPVTAQQRAEAERALKRLPLGLRGKLERLLRGETEAGIEITDAERRLIAALPAELRARIEAKLPTPDRRPGGAGPAESAAAPKTEKPASPEAAEAAETAGARDSGRDATDPRKLPLFGLDLFARTPAAAPAADLPVGPGYVVGRGDVIEVRIWSKVEDTRLFESPVARDGTVSFPKIGPVAVHGRTLADVEAQLKAAFAAVYKDATVHVTVGRLRSIPVYVTGEVRHPGLHRLAGGATVLHALFAAGGPSERGTLRRIQRRRKGGPPVSFDVYGFLTKGDRSGDVRLDPEDVVHVPLRGPTAGVHGPVMRPARYELTDGATIADLLGLAGGITALGWQGGLQVERSMNGARRELIDIPRARFGEPVRDGDMVRALELETVVRNTVEVRGHVERPGEYQWVSGLRVRDLLQRVGRLLPEAHLGRAEIFRTTGTRRAFRVQPGGAALSTAREVIPVNLERVLAGDDAQNVELRPLDRLVIYAEVEVRPPLTVSVTGEVYRPGTVAFTSGMKVSDLLFRSGGRSLPPTAHLDRADLRRLTEQKHEYAYAERTELARAPRTVIPIDLGKVLAGDGAADVTLQPFDELVVYSESDVRPSPVVSVSGAVQRPQTVELASDMRVLDLVHLAGGVLPNAHLGRAEIVRRLYDPTRPEGYRIQVIGFALGRALKGEPAANLALENFDQLIVKRLSDYAVTVTVAGEVRHPGEYTLPLGSRLSDVLQRAGGYSREAFPAGAVFTRQSVKRTQEEAIKRFLSQQRQRLLELESQVGTVATSDESAAKIRASLQARRALLDELERTEVIGRLSISLEGGVEWTRSSRNLVLRDGDTLTVPPVPASVTIQGYVYSPASVVHRPGRTVRYYVDRAGGLREEADEARIHIIRPDGSARPLRSVGTRMLRWDSDTWRWVYGRVETAVGPGDVIIVPPAVSVVSGWDVTKDIVDIVFKIALAAGTVAAIG